MSHAASAMSAQLVFEAGKVSFKKGWDDPDLIALSQLDDLRPTGPPVILIASADEVTADAARTLASLIGVGREVCVVTDGPLLPVVASWLGDEAVVHPLKSDAPLIVEVQSDERETELEQTEFIASGNHAAETTAKAEVLLPDDGSWLLAQPHQFPDPYCEFADPAEIRDLRESSGALAFWNRFVADRGMQVTKQPSQAGVPPTWVGRWSLFDQGTDGCLILDFRNGSLPMGGHNREYISVCSVIGHVPVRGSELDRSHSEQQRQFANQVTAFCEISEARAMFSRTMGGARWGNIDDLRDTQESAFGFVDKGSCPIRCLDLSPADTALLLAPQGPVEMNLPPGLGEVRLTYLVPITVHIEQSADVLAQSVDVITRTHRLLWNPSSELDGRRNSEQAPFLQAFLDGMGFVSYGAAAQKLWDAG